MHRFIEGDDRRQPALLPHSLEDYASEENPVRVVEVFIDELDLAALGFAGMTPAATGRPASDPATLLKIYLYGYLNRVQSSRRLEREAQRNVELMWLTGRLAPDFKTHPTSRRTRLQDAPDFKTIADFRKHNGAAIRAVCAQFVGLCRRLGLFTRAVVAIDGSKFKAVNSGLFTGQDFIYEAARDHYTCPAGQHLTRGRARSDRSGDIDQYRHLTACLTGPLKPRCTAEKVKRVKRWKYEGVLDAVQDRLDRMPEAIPEAMGVRRQTVEHPFGTLKAWMGATHFLTRTLDKVRTEMSLQVLAYNLKRMITIFGVGPLMAAITT